MDSLRFPNGWRDAVNLTKTDFTRSRKGRARFHPASELVADPQGNSGEVSLDGAGRKFDKLVGRQIALQILQPDGQPVRDGDFGPDTDGLTVGIDRNEAIILSFGAAAADDGIEVPLQS